MDKQKLSCGNCKHWSQQKPYQWGVCTVPIPWWATDAITDNNTVIHADNNNAGFCDCYDSVVDKPKQT